MHTKDEDAVDHLSLEQQMSAAIKQCRMSRQPVKHNAYDVGKSVEAAIKTEMAMYESCGVRGRSLQLVHNYLLSIPSASVEAERA